MHMTHVLDLFMLIIQKALCNGNKAPWGKQAWYFASSEEFVWKDAATKVSELAKEQGWLPSKSKVVSYTKEQIWDTRLYPKAPILLTYLWGSNSPARADRVGSLGWRPRAPGFWDGLGGELQCCVEQYRNDKL